MFDDPEIDKLIIYALAGMCAVLALALLIVSIRKNVYYVDENGNELPPKKKGRKKVQVEEEEEDDVKEYVPASRPVQPVSEELSPAIHSETIAVSQLSDLDDEKSDMNFNILSDSSRTLVDQVDVTITINGHVSNQTVTSFPCAIGRESANDLVISEPAVSRRHARFVTDGGKLYIEDVSEHNGTYVNKEKLSSLGRKVVNTGDIINLGRAEIRIDQIF